MVRTLPTRTVTPRKVASAEGQDVLAAQEVPAHVHDVRPSGSIPSTVSERVCGDSEAPNSPAAHETAVVRVDCQPAADCGVGVNQHRTPVNVLQAPPGDGRVVLENGAAEIDQEASVGHPHNPNGKAATTHDGAGLVASNGGVLAGRGTVAPSQVILEPAVLHHQAAAHRPNRVWKAPAAAAGGVQGPGDPGEATTCGRCAVPKLAPGEPRCNALRGAHIP